MGNLFFLLVRLVVIAYQTFHLRDGVFTEWYGSLTSVRQEEGKMLCIQFHYSSIIKEPETLNTSICFSVFLFYIPPVKFVSGDSYNIKPVLFSFSITHVGRQKFPCLLWCTTIWCLFLPMWAEFYWDHNMSIFFIKNAMHIYLGFSWFLVPFFWVQLGLLEFGIIRHFELISPQPVSFFMKMCSFQWPCSFVLLQVKFSSRFSAQFVTFSWLMPWSNSALSETKLVYVDCWTK